MPSWVLLICARCWLKIAYIAISLTCCIPKTGSSACANCTNKPANATFDTGYTGQTSNSCPWTCFTGFYPALVGSQGGEACIACSNAPDHTTYVHSGSSLGVCPWQCVAGFMQTSLPVVECAACPVGTYSSVSGTVKIFSRFIDLSEEEVHCNAVLLVLMSWVAMICIGSSYANN